MLWELPPANMVQSSFRANPFDLNGPGNFDYCASYANAPITGLASFKVAWFK